MQALVQISTNFTPPKNNGLNKKPTKLKLNFSQPINYFPNSRLKIQSFQKDRFRAGSVRGRLPFFGFFRGRNGILLGRDRGVVLVRFNEIGGGGGGGKINSETSRNLVNLGLAILLTYLTMSGQLGWLLDAIVSIWLLAVLVPIVGIGAFLWWAGRDIVQSNCPNCGNEFQIFKSTLGGGDDMQLCPFCSQPFSVVGDEFVRDPVKFSSQSTQFDQAFGDFSPRKDKGKKSSVSVVDVEAEIRDAD